MNKHLSQLILIVFSILIIISCKEEAETTPQKTPDNMDLLTSGEWVKVGYERNGVDIWFLRPECDKDDLFVYNTNGTAYADQGANKCDTSGPQRIEWQWEFVENQTKIKETILDTNVYYRDILKLTSDEMVYASYYGVSDTIVLYFAKK